MTRRAIDRPAVAASSTDAAPASYVRDGSTGTRLDLRVAPRASSNAITGVRDGALVVRVTSPPVDNAANEAVIATLAKALDLPKRGVRIVRGEGARNKTVEITGLDAATVRARLSVILA